MSRRRSHRIGYPAHDDSDSDDEEYGMARAPRERPESVYYAPMTEEQIAAQRERHGTARVWNIRDSKGRYKPVLHGALVGREKAERAQYAKPKPHLMSEPVSRKIKYKVKARIEPYDDLEELETIQNRMDDLVDLLKQVVAGESDAMTVDEVLQALLGHFRRMREMVNSRWKINSANNFASVVRASCDLVKGGMRGDPTEYIARIEDRLGQIAVDIYYWRRLVPPGYRPDRNLPFYEPTTIDLHKSRLMLPPTFRDRKHGESPLAREDKTSTSSTSVSTSVSTSSSQTQSLSSRLSSLSLQPDAHRLAGSSIMEESDALRVQFLEKKRYWMEKASGQSQSPALSQSQARTPFREPSPVRRQPRTLGTAPAGTWEWDLRRTPSRGPRSTPPIPQSSTGLYAEADPWQGAQMLFRRPSSGRMQPRSTPPPPYMGSSRAVDPWLREMSEELNQRVPLHRTRGSSHALGTRGSSQALSQSRSQNVFSPPYARGSSTNLDNQHMLNLPQMRTPSASGIRHQLHAQRSHQGNTWDMSQERTPQNPSQRRGYRP